MGGLSQMKADLHDRLWNAQQRWFEMRDQGWTKYAIKTEGIRQAGDPNLLMRPILFTGRTRTTYEGVLKCFLEFAHEKFEVQRLDDVGTPHARAFLDDAIRRGLAAKTLQLYRSALAKLGALTGQSASFAALSVKYGDRIRDLVASEHLAGPERATPSLEVAHEAVEILREWDDRHRLRTGRPRAYHLAARLQIETAARSVSASTRVTLGALKDGHRIALVGKGGRILECEVSPDLHAALRRFLTANPGGLADLPGYRMAWRRAIQTAGGRITGTHGLRRRSIREFYGDEYRRLLAGGAAPDVARREARARAVERLGHGRDRREQAACYLDPAV